MKIGDFETNNIYLGDCYELIKKIPDKSVDLIITDPPYQFAGNGGGGCFGSKKRDYHGEYVSLYHEKGCSDAETERLRIKSNVQKSLVGGISHLSRGFEMSLLDEFCRIMKNIYIYIWCSKNQVGKILNYFENKGCNTDIICWHKTNPIPTCNNTYLSDTEYCILARENGCKVLGTYETKKKWYVSPANTDDKDLYDHPTIKPLDIIKNLIINSSKENDIVLDTFMGSGTTAVACKELNRQYLGFEIDKEYYQIACDRLKGITQKDKREEQKEKESGIQNIFDFIKEEQYD